MTALLPTTLQGDGPIEITRDPNGVPIIRASWDTDLLRGLGYCHGVDRALQMLVLRVLTQGRGCELLADTDEMLGVDRFFRRLNLGHDTEEELRKLPPAFRALVDAYTDGVNRALDRRLPWELKLLGYVHEPWRAEDIIALSRLIAYVNLAQSQGDMERLLVELVQAGVTRVHLDELFPDLLGELDTYMLRKVELGERVVPEALTFLAAVPKTIASNNWVVSGARTASGRAMLANDPHLEVNRLPAVWYEAVLQSGERYHLGGTMPGLPAMLICRGAELSWGVTYAFMDGIDSWIEDCKDGCFRRVQAGQESWEPFAVRREQIKRKKHPDVEAVFYENAHGVLDGDPNKPGLYLSTRWASGSGTGAASLAAMAGLLSATEVAQGMKLLGHMETAWNWVLADHKGNIGYQMSGRLPERAGTRTGFVPLPGWDPVNDWQGVVPPDRLPWIINPEAGFFVTANNDLNAWGRSRPINMPMGSYRADRIAARLAEREDWTVEAMAELQLDLVSAQAEPYMALLRPLLPRTPAGEVLRDWDGRYDLESQGAWLFERFRKALLVEVFGPALGEKVVAHLLEETGIVADFYACFDRVVLADGGAWYGDRKREDVFRSVAAAVLTGPIQTLGSERQIVMSHLLFGGKLPRFLGFDFGPIGLPGSAGTVRQGQVYRSGGRVTSFAPSYRLVTDFAEQGAHTALAGGVSDRRFSGLYTSDVARWRDGVLKRLVPGPPVAPAPATGAQSPDSAASSQAPGAEVAGA